MILFLRKFYLTYIRLAGTFYFLIICVISIGRYYEDRAFPIFARADSLYRIDHFLSKADKIHTLPINKFQKLWFALLLLYTFRDKLRGDI
jgi:hypothetical protein